MPGCKRRRGPLAMPVVEVAPDVRALEALVELIASLELSRATGTLRRLADRALDAQTALDEVAALRASLPGLSDPDLDDVLVALEDHRETLAELVELAQLAECTRDLVVDVRALREHVTCLLEDVVG